MQNASLYSLFWVFWVVILIEAIVIGVQGNRQYAWQESLASLGVAIGHFGAVSAFKFINAGALLFAWHHRLFTVPLQTGWGILLLFISLEFFYYWYHRASHRISWLWATHAVHHSAEQFNLSAAYRLGWTGTLSGGFLFFMPLSWLGFDPIAVAVGLSLNLMYQFWIHTELIPKLGVLELFLNTPSHHRVHHASNQDYLDCNFGGVLIVFDRLFGTYQIERAANPPVYGLTQPIRSYNPFVIALGQWHRLLRTIGKASTWQQRLQAGFYPPN
jgi:sterol desaturase/sphingolipid hydroxylase (fatty acid hydroxylase superfamily)